MVPSYDQTYDKLTIEQKSIELVQDEHRITRALIREKEKRRRHMEWIGPREHAGYTASLLWSMRWHKMLCVCANDTHQSRSPANPASDITTDLVQNTVGRRQKYPADKHTTHLGIGLLFSVCSLTHEHLFSAVFSCWCFLFLSAGRPHAYCYLLGQHGIRPNYKARILELQEGARKKKQNNDRNETHLGGFAFFSSLLLLILFLRGGGNTMSCLLLFSASSLSLGWPAWNLSTPTQIIHTPISTTIKCAQQPVYAQTTNTYM